LRKSSHNILGKDFDKFAYLEKEFEMKKAIWTIVVILFLAATLCACSSNKFPTGTYTHGDTSVEFRDDGTYALMDGNEVVTEGTYSIQDDQLQYITDSYCDAENAGPATYKWQYDEDKEILSYQLITDNCEGRRMQHTLNWFGPK
jgi:hypothetical protein